LCVLRGVRWTEQRGFTASAVALCGRSGVSWRIEGELPAEGAVVSNHVSYLDILLYAAVRPLVMVAKSEVRGWPLIGWLTSRAGTVYVVRGGGPATYREVNRAMAEAYRSGLPVLFYPEGTTTDGSQVLPFRRGLFHSVLNERVVLRTAALAYSIDGDSGVATVAEDVCWWGDALLAPHLWRLAGIDGVRAVVRFGEVVAERGDRFVLSEQARERVQEMYAELRGEGPAARWRRRSSWWRRSRICSTDQSRASVPWTVMEAWCDEGITKRSAMGLAVASNWARTLSSVRPRSRMSR